jgi:hypothetical protein
MWGIWSRYTKVDPGISLAQNLWTLFTFLTAGGSVSAWLLTQWTWYWQTFGWGGLAIGFLLSWIILALGVFLAGIGFKLLRKQKSPEADRGDPHLNEYSNDPESTAPDKQAYKDLLDFSLDRLLPACEAQIRFQDALVRKACSNDLIAEFATEGMRSTDRFKTHNFWSYYTKLILGLTDSPGPIITFDKMLDYIFELEKEGYKTFCDQAAEIASVSGVDQRVDELWTSWRVRHTALVDTYEPIKRDPRFGKLLRPARPSRWGDRKPIKPQAKIADAAKSSLIPRARQFVSETVRKNPNEEYFRGQLESDTLFLELKPHLSPDFLHALMSGRVAVVPPGGSRMPGLAWAFIEEIDRIERER